MFRKYETIKKDERKSPKTTLPMRHLLILFLSSLMLSTNAQMNAIVEYHQMQEGKLNWAHIPLSEKISGAQSTFTYCGISYTISSDIKGLHCEYRAFVDLNESWVHKDARTSEQLNHEQGLFDLTEVYARRMNQFTQEFIQSEGPNLTHQSLMQQVRKIYKEQNNLLFMEQQRYNLETNHGKNKDLQAVWDQKIAMSLNQLDVFKASATE